MKTYKTREEVINELTDAVIQSDNIADILYDGVRGYKDYTNQELTEEWYSWVGDEEELIIGDNPITCKETDIATLEITEDSGEEWNKKKIDINFSKEIEKNKVLL